MTNTSTSTRRPATNADLTVDAIVYMGRGKVAYRVFTVVRPGVVGMVKVTSKNQNPTRFAKWTAAELTVEAPAPATVAEIDEAHKINDELDRALNDAAALAERMRAVPANAVNEDQLVDMLQNSGVYLDLVHAALYRLRTRETTALTQGATTWQFRKLEADVFVVEAVPSARRFRAGH